MKSSSLLVTILLVLSFSAAVPAEVMVWGKIYQGGSYTPLPQATVTISGEWQLQPGGAWSPLNVQTASDSSGLYSVQIYRPIKDNQLKVCVVKSGWREHCIYRFQVHEGQNDLSVWLQSQ